MKILVIGYTGTIGKTVYDHFKNKYETYGASRSDSNLKVDITDEGSIHSLFEKLPKLDAVINASGTAVWKPFDQLTSKDYNIGFQSKLMGQINLTRIAADYLKPSSSITLITGILAENYEPGTSALAAANGALHSFVNTAHHELPDRIRLNVVAPGAIIGDFPSDQKFAGHFPIPSNKLTIAYDQILNSDINGEVVRIYS